MIWSRCARALLVLELPAPSDEVARRQCHAGGDGRPRFLDEAADVAPLNVQQDGGEQQPVLGCDHRGAARLLEARDLCQRHLLPGRGGDQHVAERLRLVAVLRRVPHPHGKRCRPSSVRVTTRSPMAVSITSCTAATLSP